MHDATRPAPPGVVVSADDTPLTERDTRLLAALLYLADDGGLVVPGEGQLTDMTGIRPSPVKACLRNLERSGRIVRAGIPGIPAWRLAA